MYPYISERPQIAGKIFGVDTGAAVHLRGILPGEEIYPQPVSGNIVLGNHRRTLTVGSRYSDDDRLAAGVAPTGWIR